MESEKITNPMDVLKIFLIFFYAGVKDTYGLSVVIEATKIKTGLSKKEFYEIAKANSFPFMPLTDEHDKFIKHSCIHFMANLIKSTNFYPWFRDSCKNKEAFISTILRIKNKESLMFVPAKAKPPKRPKVLMTQRVVNPQVEVKNLLEST